MCIPKSRRSEHVNQLPAKNVDEDHGDYKDDGVGETENVPQDNVRHSSEKQTGELQTSEHQAGEQQAVEQQPIEQQRCDRIVYEKSFKVARSSKNARDMVQQWVNRALDMGVPRLVQEFRNSLARWQPEGMTVNAFLANRDKNRYLDVPCQDARRVIVNWPGLPNDYIHANFVANPTTDNRFICTQGKYKCSQYWPREIGETLAFGEGLGKIIITNVDAAPLSNVDHFVRVCRLKVNYIENGMEASSMIRHFQWENWPDRGVPPTKLTATNILSEVRGTKKPIVVHCSAGIGRTGTIVAIAYVQEKMQYGQNCMYMDALTRELRTQRPYSIQNEYQYIYVHRVLLAYFLEKYRDRFAQLLEGDGEAKYAKWREEYKMFTGCD